MPTKRCYHTENLQRYGYWIVGKSPVIYIHLRTSSAEDHGLSLLIDLYHYAIGDNCHHFQLIPKSHIIPTILITIMTMTSGCRSWLIGKLRKAGLGHDSQDITLSAFPWWWWRGWRGWRWWWWLNGKHDKHHFDKVLLYWRWVFIVISWRGQISLSGVDFLHHQGHH